MDAHLHMTVFNRPDLCAVDKKFIHHFHLWCSAGQIFYGCIKRSFIFPHFVSINTQNKQTDKIRVASFPNTVGFRNSFCDALTPLWSGFDHSVAKEQKWMCVTTKCSSTLKAYIPNLQSAGQSVVQHGSGGYDVCFPQMPNSIQGRRNMQTSQSHQSINSPRKWWHTPATWWRIMPRTRTNPWLIALGCGLEVNLRILPRIASQQSGSGYHVEVCVKVCPDH